MLRRIPPKKKKNTTHKQGESSENHILIKNLCPENINYPQNHKTKQPNKKGKNKRFEQPIHQKDK